MAIIEDESGDAILDEDEDAILDEGPQAYAGSITPAGAIADRHSSLNRTYAGNI